jgi:hypothetical protein
MTLAPPANDRKGFDGSLVVPVPDARRFAVGERYCVTVEAKANWMIVNKPLAVELLECKLIAPYITSGFLEPRPREKTMAWLKELSERSR